MITVLQGDCLDVLPTLGERFAACVTDPPYGLEFMGKEWDAPWQVSSSSALFGKRKSELPGWGVTRNPTCKTCGGRLRGARKCGCDVSSWDEAPANTRLRQMAAYQSWCEQWARAVFDALLPGAHLVCFGGTRTWHRMACAIEDAGFEIRDTLCWLYGSGFPKSLDVSKAIDKAAGAEREVIGVKPGHEQFAGRQTRGHIDFKGATEGFDRPWMHDDVARERYHAQTAPATPEAARWQGWGTALKPAHEPIILARKPLIGTVAANVLAHGTGAINVDGCRVPPDGNILLTPKSNPANRTGVVGMDMQASGDAARNQAEQAASIERTNTLGRWPTNCVHDGSAEVEAAFAAFGERRSKSGQSTTITCRTSHWGDAPEFNGARYSDGDTGTASRFFFSAKASAADRADSKHPTVKPIDLMRWLVRLVTPPGGAVLDPFAGSGTTGEAAMLEGFDATLIERDATHAADIAHRIKRWSGLDAPLFAEAAE